MIIVEIGLGLGNSMFVYAAAKALAEHHNTELKLDISYLNSWPKKKDGISWDFKLEKFNISSKIATKREVRKFIYKTKSRHLNKIFRKFRLFEKKGKVYEYGTYDSKEGFFRLPDNIYLRGYFGDKKFFESIKEKIKKEYNLKEDRKQKIKPFLGKISSENSVSIHIRRGDLLKIGAFIVPIDYYKKAIEIIKKKVNNPKFYVFSDGIDWCKNNLKDLGKLNFVEGNKDYEDLELMKECKHNILANSALSWWAGYLNKNPGKIVIAPKKFAHFSTDKRAEERLPKDWIKI